MAQRGFRVLVFWTNEIKITYISLKMQIKINIDQKNRKSFRTPGRFFKGF